MLVLKLEIVCEKERPNTSRPTYKGHSASFFIFYLLTFDLLLFDVYAVTASGCGSSLVHHSRRGDEAARPVYCFRRSGPFWEHLVTCSPSQLTCVINSIAGLQRCVIPRFVSDPNAATGRAGTIRCDLVALLCAAGEFWSCWLRLCTCTKFCGAAPESCRARTLTPAATARSALGLLADSGNVCFGEACDPHWSV